MKLLKFSASYCQPCKMLSKVIEGVQVNMPIEEIDIENPDTMDTVIEFGVRGVPTLIVVDDQNTVIKRKSGYMNESQFKQFIG